MKRLILLFDGTWNSAATGHFGDITNVFRLNLAISRSDSENVPQITFYSPGPGNRGIIDKELGGIFGQGLDQIVREAYVNLSSNFEEGDEIYLFGYSRGSVAARALSCLIAESGLLKPQQLHRLAAAWDRFVSINSGVIQSAYPSELNNHVHKNVRIKFVGLFDSVLGRKYKSKNRFSDLVFRNNAVSPIIDRGVHILSIDDDRKLFRPMVWGARHPRQKVEQIWMPGVHSDIGGHGRPEFIGIAALLTMIAKVRPCGVAFNQNFLNSMTNILENMDRMRIQNERPGIVKKFLPRLYRAPGESQHVEKKHPLLDILYNNKMILRDRKKKYNHWHLKAFRELEIDENEYTQLIKDCAEGTLART